MKNRRADDENYINYQIPLTLQNVSLPPSLLPPSSDYSCDINTSWG